MFLVASAALVRLFLNACGLELFAIAMMGGQALQDGIEDFTQLPRVDIRLRYFVFLMVFSEKR